MSHLPAATHALRFSLVWALLLVSGCLKAAAPDRAQAPSSVAFAGSAAAAPSQADDAKAAASPGLAQVPARKVIRNAELHIVVAAYRPAAQALEKLARETGGFVAQSDVHHELSRVSTATWVLRLPAGGLDGALAVLRNLGTVTAEKVTADDVTEAYVDLKGRLANAKASEARLLELLAHKTEKLSDVLEVERELGRTRGEVESMEGKLRLLDHRIDLSTLTVQLRVEEKYVPPVAPGFWGELGETFVGSLEGLVDFGAGLLTFTVAVVPWLLVLGPLGWLFVRGLRWLRRKLWPQATPKPPNAA